MVHHLMSYSKLFNPSDRNMALGSTQPLTDISSGGKGGRYAGLTNFKGRLSRNSGSINLLEPQWPVQACNGIALPLPVPYTRLLPLQSLKKY